MTKCLLCGSDRNRSFAVVRDRVVSVPDASWEIVQCCECRSGWTTPEVPEDKIGGYYPAGYLGDVTKLIDDYVSGRLQKTRSWKKEVEKRDFVERFTTAGRLLDVGCGAGTFLWTLDRKRWVTTGVEPSKQVVAEVKGRLSGIELVAGDIYSPVLSGRRFDVITFWHVFEHLHRPQEVLRRSRELLVPGGVIFVSLPNLDSWQADTFREHWYAFDDVPRHLYHYSPRGLEILLKQADFRNIGHFFFSRIVNFHCLKHSLLNWSRVHFGSAIPYYSLKPLLLLAPGFEAVTKRGGIFTAVARKPGN